MYRISLESLFFGLLVAAVALMLPGCANYVTPEPGAIAISKDRIPLDEKTSSGRIFKDDELQLDYLVAIAGDSYTFSGRLRFDRSITDSFEAIKQFAMTMNFLDSEGRVLQSVDITPFYRKYVMVPTNPEISRSGMKPLGATHIVFNYIGVFKGVMAGYKDDWEIIYFPFE